MTTFVLAHLHQRKDEVWLAKSSYAPCLQPKQHRDSSQLTQCATHTPRTWLWSRTASIPQAVRMLLMPWRAGGMNGRRRGISWLSGSTKESYVGGKSIEGTGGQLGLQKRQMVAPMSFS